MNRSRSIRAGAIALASFLAFGAGSGLTRADASQETRDPSDGDDASIDLRPKFVEGRKLPYVLEQKTVTSRGEFRQIVSMRTGQTLETAKVDAAGVMVDLTYTDCSMILANPDGELVYDSKNPDAPGTSLILGSLVHAFVGKTLRVSASPAGEVRTIDGVEAIREGPQGEALKEFFRDDALKRTLAQVFRPSPGKDVATKGEIWSTQQRSPFDGIAELVVTYHMGIESVDGDIARLRIRGEAAFEPRKAGVRVPYSVEKQKITGAVEWDRRLGVLLAHDLSTDLEIEAEDESGEEVTFAIAQTSKTRLEKTRATEPRPGS